MDPQPFWINGTLVRDAAACVVGDVDALKLGPFGEREHVPQAAAGRPFLGPQAYGSGLVNGGDLCLYWIGYDENGQPVVLGTARTTVSEIGQGHVPEGTAAVVVRGQFQVSMPWWLYIGAPEEQ